MSKQPFIQLQKVSFAYPKGPRVLSNISLSLHTGEVTAIVGPNGGGKTTLSKLLVGILKPTSGQILLEQKDLGGYRLAEVGRKVGYLFQNPDQQLFAPTVYEELAFALKYQGYETEVIDQKVQRFLNMFELSHVAEALPFKISQGEKQRTIIAALLINEPTYLILDEPTTSIDVKRKEALSRIIATLRQQGIGMTLISHDQGFIQQHAERIVHLEGGVVIADDCRQL